MDLVKRSTRSPQSRHSREKVSASITACLVILVTLTACTQQLPDAFRLEQQEESFAASEAFNSRLDILWVIDNSGSMAEEQQKIRDGFVSFAERYMKPYWDIRLAVITTDTYLAHPAFTNWTDQKVSSTANYDSLYINGVTNSGYAGRSDPLSNPNPPWDSSVYHWSSSSSKWLMNSAGISARQMRPYLGRNWARLLDNDPATGTGNHDGPGVILCSEWHMPLSISPLFTDARCSVRDDIARVSPPANDGPARCISPDTASGEKMVTECVNTAQNNTVHSGKSILSTFGVPERQLVDSFIINATVGTVGSGIEQGINSVLQLLADNEAPDSTTKFFRPNSLRAVIFVSDEEDISIVYPEDGSQVTPLSRLRTGSTCTKTVDGHTYQIGYCPDPAIAYPNVGAAQPVAEVKNRLDSFFRGLDGNAEGDPNYFIVTITALTAETVALSGDQATRNLQLGEAVGNGSLSLEINSNDYSPLLDSIGKVIVEKKGEFKLRRAPTSKEEMVVAIRHADGSEELIPASKYTISGDRLIISDPDLVLSFLSTDTITINYQPKTIL